MAIQKAIEKIVVDLTATMVAQTKSHRHHQQQLGLKSLSLWLASFQWCGEDDYLELPGQYGGDQRPVVSEHVRIVKFNEKIEVFQTLRKPCKLTMHGNDGRTYSFLVKHGDDLRQDERIQQLLAMMSRRMANDRMCRTHSMRIETYRVIPMKLYCGLIEWVNKTKSMMDIINRSMARRDVSATTTTTTTGGYRDKLRTLQNRHRDVMCQPSMVATENVQNYLHLYGNAVTQNSCMDVRNKFQALCNELPEDLVRRALYEMCQSAESFYSLRSQFAISLSAMSVAHWVLGIGDRHLSNMLMDCTTGRVVGIDFGQCFGAATRSLAVPELLPFRLTPRLVSVMSPLGVTGLISKCLLHALQCLRDSKLLLMACMEVMVKDPAIGWLTSERAPKDLRTDDAKSWAPLHRIDIARRKLNGDNPTALLLEELQVSSVSTYVQ